MEFSEITCPTCFEVFPVAVPPLEERPTSLDYDCEICCRPMFIEVDVQGYAYAQSVDEL